MFSQFSWNAADYIRSLTEKNRLARRNGYTYRNISGLGELEEILKGAIDDTAFIAVADDEDGVADIDNTPNTRTVRTIFIAMRHEPDDPVARARAQATNEEIFRQFLTHLIREVTRIRRLGIYLDPRIEFHRIPRYFATGAACAWFQIATTTPVNLIYNPDDWEP